MSAYPPLKALIVLDTAMRTRSFSLAAEELCVTPGAGWATNSEAKGMAWHLALYTPDSTSGTEANACRARPVLELPGCLNRRCTRIKGLRR